MPLWISVHLPLLPLEAHRPCWCEPGEYALLDMDRVLLVSTEAAAAGVRPGMRRGGVSAVSASTLLLERDLQKEQLAFDGIAMALLQFTPEITYADDFSILLNVTASLRLFGGRLALGRQLRHSIRALGFTAKIGSAPTAMAAWLLARARSARRQPLLRRTVKVDTMSRQLDRLPCQLLPGTAQHAEWLRGIGCDTLGQLSRFPRAGLQRRTNKQLMDAMDKAYGLAPELFEWIKTPEVFSARIETHDRIEHAEALLFGAHRLILHLVGWLVSLQQAVTRFVLLLEHERGCTAILPMRLEVALPEPTWRKEHLVCLPKERLGRHVLQTIENVVCKLFAQVRCQMPTWMPIVHTPYAWRALDPVSYHFVIRLNAEVFKLNQPVNLFIVLTTIHCRQNWLI